MARVRTGPRGHERYDRSIGEAGAGVDGLAALGRLSALRVPGIDGAAVAVGAGPIERRMATADELAAVAARDSRPPVLPVRPKAPAPTPPCQHVWGPRTGAGRMHVLAVAEGWVEVVCVRCGADHDAPATRTPSRPEEEPMPAPAPPPAVPCGTCLHAEVCSYRRAVEDELASQAGKTFELRPGVRFIGLGIRIECDHYLGAAAAPEPIRREHGGESWRTPAVAAVPGHKASAVERREKTERAQRVTEALERHGGDKYAAARELGMPVKAIVNVAKNAYRWLPEQPKAVPA